MNELLQSGVELMVVGMGIVFVFLASLVGIINLTAYLIRRFATELNPVTPAKPTQSTPDQQETIAAITAAIYRYRASK